jgi:hypothetical protein
MERVIVTMASDDEITGELLDFAEFEPNMFDRNVLRQASTFVLCARQGHEKLAYLPVQQPLMLESHLFRPGLDDRLKALAMGRLTEYAAGEAYRRGSGELYFLSQRPETAAFAARHGFQNLWKSLKLETYRLNLLETFGEN